MLVYKRSKPKSQVLVPACAQDIPSLELSLLMLSASPVEIDSSPLISHVSFHTWSRNMILTLHFTIAFNLTAWGWQDCQYDKEDGSYGGLLTKLIFRTLPDHYPTGSVLAHFPFNIPENMLNALKKNCGSIQKYCWPERLKDLPDNIERLRPVINPTWRVVRDYEGVKRVLTTENSHFTSNIVRRMESTVELVLKQRIRVRDSIMFHLSRRRTE